MVCELIVNDTVTFVILHSLLPSLLLSPSQGVIWESFVGLYGEACG